jgi:hypothetical protein
MDEEVKMKIAFIYRPRSGDRVFTHIGGESAGVAEHPNGCRHVACAAIVRVEAAESGHWFRDEARDLVTRVAGRFGGVGWDECGTIHYAVPTRAAAVAAGYGLAALAHRAGARQEAHRLMFESWMLMRGHGRGFRYDPQPPEAAPGLLIELWERAEEYETPAWTVNWCPQGTWVEFSSEGESRCQPTVWEKKE